MRVRYNVHDATRNRQRTCINKTPAPSRLWRYTQICIYTPVPIQPCGLKQGTPCLETTGAPAAGVRLVDQLWSGRLKRTRAHARVHAQVYTHARTYTHTYTGTCARIHTHTRHAYAFTQTRRHAYTQTHTHTHTHADTQAHPSN